MSLKIDAKLILHPSGFGDGKWYSFKGADFDVVRNTSATRYNKIGVLEYILPNYPRIDYLNGTPDILIEPEKTNLVSRSNEFNSSPWGVLGGAVITSNFSLSPSNQNDAWKIEDTSTNFQGLRQGSITIASGTTYTGSIFLKKTTGVLSSFPLLQFAVTNISVGVIVDTTNGVINTIGSPTNSGIQDWGDYWRVFASQISNQTTGTFDFFPAGSADGTTTSGTPTGSSIIYGAQLETGGLTSYKQSFNLSTVRNADIHTVAVPAGTTEIREYLPNGTYNSITTIPTTYQIPIGRWQKIIMI